MNKELTYQQRVDHLKAGYENVQSVVRLLDAKASAVVAGVTAVFGLIVALFKWFFTFFPKLISESCCCGRCGLLLIGLIIFIPFGIYLSRSLKNAYLTLVPRDTGGSDPSPIFPVIPTGGELDEKTQLFAQAQEERIEMYGRTCLEADAIKDYTEQLKQMGKINYFKLQHCKIAVASIFPFIISSGVISVFVVLCWGWLKFS